MSGSPVIFNRNGLHNLIDGKLHGNSILGTVTGFVGVYSGRIGAKDEFQAQLGLVWKKGVIEEILNGKVLGTTEFQKV